MTPAPPPDLLLASVARALLEVAWFSLLGQGALALLVGQRRHGNLIYKLWPSSPRRP